MSSSFSGSTTFLTDVSLDEKIFSENIDRGNVSMNDDAQSSAEQEEEIVDKGGLRRVVGLYGGISLIVGTIIGSGIFISPTSILLRTQSVGFSLMVWFLCGVIAIMGSICYVELGLFIPKSGGEYPYMYEAFGPLVAFLYSWSSVLVLKPASLSAICYAFSIYCLGPFYTGEAPAIYLKLLTAAAIVVITVVNSLSTHLATRVQIIFTVAKMLAIVLLIGTGLVRIGQGYTDNFKDSFEGSSTNAGQVGFAFYAGLWAYDGWNNLNYATEEVKNPRKNLPLSIFIGIPAVTVCYLLVNIAYFTVINEAEMLASSAVAVTLADKLYGKMAFIIPLLVACSTFGAANGSAFSGGRVIYAAARKGHLPKLLCMIQKNQRTPLPALIFNSLVAVLMLLPDSSEFETLMGYFSFTAWLGYGMTFAGLIWLRVRRPDDMRPFKVWLVVPIILILASSFFVIAPYYEDPVACTLCLLFILSGIPVYLLVCRYKKLPESCDMGFSTMTSILQRSLGLILPPELQPPKTVGPAE